MEIREKDEQFMILAPKFGVRLFGIIFSVVVSIIVLSVLFFISFALLKSGGLLLAASVALPIVLLYIGVWVFIVERIVFDKLSSSVILEKPNYRLVRKKRVIPFADVMVLLKYKPLLQVYALKGKLLIHLCWNNPDNQHKEQGILQHQE